MGGTTVISESDVAAYDVTDSVITDTGICGRVVVDCIVTAPICVDVVSVPLLSVGVAVNPVARDNVRRGETADVKDVELSVTTGALIPACTVV